MKQLILFALLINMQFAIAQSKFSPPITEKKPVVDTLHGFYITDNYRWLENKNDPKVIAWTKAQHDYGEQYLKATQKIHPNLREEITAYMEKDYEGPIQKIDKRIFQIIQKKDDKQYKLYTIIDNKKILIWDPVMLDSTGNTATQYIAYSYNGEIAAITVQKNGAEIPTLYLINTRSGKILQGPIEGIGGADFTKDQQHLYLTTKTLEGIKQKIPAKTYCLKIGDPIENAEFIGTTIDPQFGFYIYDNKYSYVSFYGEKKFYSNNCKMKKTGTKGKGVLIYESKKFSAYPTAIGDKLYILTNDNAPNKRFMIADIKHPQYKYWKTLIPEGETIIENVEILKDERLIVQDKKNIQSRLTLFNTNGKKIKSISLPEAGNIDYISYNREEDSVYLSISTLISPNKKIYVTSPKNFKWRLYYSYTSPIDVSNITSSTQYYFSKDSTKIPCAVIHRKDIKLNGNNPTLLNGYGGFNLSILSSPYNYAYYAPFINRGGVLVIAGIRGGSEYGDKWHEGGMLANKQNCFDDFNACAEWLIKEKYTNPNRLVAIGASNGGLLMGAIATQRPDLYKAIICDVPLLDMLRYNKFLLGHLWISEYGDPYKMPDFTWLLHYSPYHNIRQGINLPTMLITAGANDTRVDALHAKKFVAALQNNSGQINPIILHMDFDSGHGSGKTTQQWIDTLDFEFEFIMNQLGM